MSLTERSHHSDIYKEHFVQFEQCWTGAGRKKEKKSIDLNKPCLILMQTSQKQCCPIVEKENATVHGRTFSRWYHPPPQTRSITGPGIDGGQLPLQNGLSCPCLMTVTCKLSRGNNSARHVAGTTQPRDLLWT